MANSESVDKLQRRAHPQRIMKEEVEIVLGTSGRKNPKRERKVKNEDGSLPTIAAIAAVAAIPTASTATATAIPTAAAAAPAAITATSPAATGAFGLRASFVHDKVPATEVLAVKAVDCAIRILIVGNFDEGEATRLTRKAIANQTDC